MQVAVAGAGARGVGLVEEGRGARALALLPHRLRAVKAGAAVEVAIEPRGRERRRESLLRLDVPVVVEEAHASRDPLGRRVRSHERGLGRRQRRREGLDALARAVRPGLERRLGPHAAVDRRRVGEHGVHAARGRRRRLERLRLLEQRLGAPWSGREAIEVRLEGRERFIPASERSQGVDAHELRLGRGHRPGRHEPGPGQRRRRVSAPELAARGVKRVIRRELRIHRVELLEG